MREGREPEEPQAGTPFAPRDEALSHRVTPDGAEEHVRRHRHEGAPGDDGAGHAAEREVLHVFHRREAERCRAAINDAVDGLVEFGPATGEQRCPEPLGALFDKAYGQREHRDGKPQSADLAPHRDRRRIKPRRRLRQAHFSERGGDDRDTPEAERSHDQPHRLGPGSVETPHEEKPRKRERKGKQGAGGGQPRARREPLRGDPFPTAAAAGTLRAAAWSTHANTR
jgi:hypothetical protein